ncbi:pyridoxamine kinase [bacterium]|nr:pyridoxamine kinase [bacterium]
MKRIITIQDISCVGKCSLTVALPIISAMGVEAAVLPTAVLSTHTAFKNFTFRDLTSDIPSVSKHFKSEKFKFDAIYTGYLGSVEQINLVAEFFDEFKTNDNIIVVDPVMGDNGKLYSGFTKDFVNKMRRLCSNADIIIPNLTEASFLLDIEYKNDYNEVFIKDVLKRLSDLGIQRTVLTGVSFNQNEIGTMMYDSSKNEYYSCFSEKINDYFHGTGDIFASTCVGALMNDLSLQKSLNVAVDYTYEAIKTTVNSKNSNWYGVDFERVIPDLIKMLNEEKALVY